MDPISFFILLFCFVFGAVAGSFLNCMVLRLKSKEDFFYSRSHCPLCRRSLQVEDLVPLWSYVELGGKCRYCGQKISFQYFAVELAGGALFSLTAAIMAPQLVFGFDFSLENILPLVYYWIILASLLAIFIYDLRWYLIPDEILIFSTCAVVLYRLYLAALSNFSSASFEVMGEYFLTALAASSFFLAIFLFSRGKWMGFGDVKLSAFMGFFLGFPQIATALFLAFFIGAIIGVWLIVLKKKTASSEIPFGPFLVFGTAAALFWGEKIFNWYLSFGL